MISYFCRGCGQPLPPGRARQFHTECLKIDKQRRVAARREQRRRQFTVWASRLHCENCGEPFKVPGERSEPALECPSEASQGLRTDGTTGGEG